MISSRHLLLLLLAAPSLSLAQTPAIPNQPFTAVKKSTTIQKLADGTTITRFMNSTEARDSQGRLMHKQEFLTPPQGRQASTYNVFVQDPAARTTTQWMVPGKDATVRSLPPLPPGVARTSSGGTASSAAFPAQPAAGSTVQLSVSGSNMAPTPPRTSDPNQAPHRPSFQTEKLEGKVINGIYAVGTKNTTTFPIGFFGNDRPVVMTREIWTSPDLKLIIASTDEDPRSGTTTTELISIDRAEPDPSLFTPPQGYTIRHEDWQGHSE